MARRCRHPGEPVTTIRLATRESALALWQTEHVAALLRATHPHLTVELVPMTTRGDQVLDQPLAKIGGKGLFLKELEVAMLEGRADAAVHSMKDVPMALEPGFMLAAVLERADPFDAFVSNTHDTLQDLPAGARVGTSSLRRQAQVRALRPDLELLDLRGNVQTRLGRLDAGGYDAILLACAGLLRLGLGERIRSRLTALEWVPAVAQGAIGIECRDGDSATAALFAPLAHEHTTLCVSAERAMNLCLHGSCHVPVAGYATLSDDGQRLHLQGLVGEVASGRCVRAEAEAPAGQADALGRQVAEALLAQGARAMLQG
jgi:hydroxymethylbilane synthase